MSIDKEKGVELTISKLKAEDIVEINGFKYTYKAQQIVNIKGVKLSQYVFICDTVKGFDKTFDINTSLKFLKFKNGKIILKL